MPDGSQGLAVECATTVQCMQVAGTSCPGGYNVVSDTSHITQQPNPVQAAAAAACIAQRQQNPKIVCSTEIGTVPVEMHSLTFQCKGSGPSKQETASTSPNPPTASAPTREAASMSAVPSGSGCAKDTDCKGDRICDRGACVSPASPSAVREKGHGGRSKLGLTFQVLTQEIAATKGLPDTKGVLVSALQPGGAAAQAGLLLGDVIVAFNGTPLQRAEELPLRVASSAPGTVVDVTVVREGQRRVLKAKLEALPEETERGTGPRSGAGSEGAK